MPKHDDDSIDLNILWDTIEFELPSLISELKKIKGISPTP